ncbi:hypothetical protein PVAP13_2NG096246, partial [Panicum virgatum]
MPWDCIAPFCGLAAAGQGFHVIPGNEVEDDPREMANCALITITRGIVTARQLENEFKSQAGPTSTWRWFAKKIADNKYQMRFPTAKKVEDLSFFTGMQMRTVPEVFFNVEKWNSNAGAKAAIDSAWFMIFGLPFEKRTERKVCFVASLVGLPLEVDKVNLKKWEFVRVKIGCKDITKVPAIREVPIEGVTNAAGNTWTRTDRADDDNSSKKPKRDHGKDQQGGEDQSNLEGSETKMGDQNHNHQPQYRDQN